MCECPACVAKAEGRVITGYCVRVFDCQCLNCCNWRASNFDERQQPCAKTFVIIEGREPEEFVLHAEIAAPAEEWLDIPAFLRQQQQPAAVLDVERFRNFMRGGSGGLDIEDVFQNGGALASPIVGFDLATKPAEIALSVNFLDECGDQVEVLRVSIEGVHYMGELVKDAGEAYRAVIGAMGALLKQTGGRVDA